MTHRLHENNQEVKIFTEEEVKKITQEKYDYTIYFKQPDSQPKLMEVIRDRGLTLGFTEPPDFWKNTQLVDDYAKAAISKKLLQELEKLKKTY